MVEAAGSGCMCEYGLGNRAYVQKLNSPAYFAVRLGRSRDGTVQDLATCLILNPRIGLFEKQIHGESMLKDLCRYSHVDRRQPRYCLDARLASLHPPPRLPSGRRRSLADGWTRFISRSRTTSQRTWSFSSHRRAYAICCSNAVDALSVV